MAIIGMIKTAGAYSWAKISGEWVVKLVLNRVTRL